MRTSLIELQEFLKTEYQVKSKFNSAYSKRAFARDLGIPATNLNEFLAGKRDLSFPNLNSVFRYINSRIHCSFCDKAQKDAAFVIAGPRKLYICDECVDSCAKIAKEERLQK